MFELFILISIPVWLVIGWIWLNYKDSRDEWQPLADELGLEFEWSGPFLGRGVAGTYRGMDVSVRVFGRHQRQPIGARDKHGNRLRKLGEADSRGSGHATYVIKSDKLLPGFALTEEGVGSKVTKLLGAQDVEVGSAPLDDAFVIKADNPSLAREVLGRAGIESALLKLRYKTSKIELADGTLRVNFVRAHHAYEVSAYIAKLTGLMAMLAPVAPTLHSPDKPEDESQDVPATADALPENWW
ncbi:hypothetical protein FIV42_01935 [Persicimonas caeni]|uniref:DUF3137 domain-containing protein n=1 Tax=Persicimonas caeni TaxID=2292766 RepID=A0A4Y6PMT5_PERCE|nr:hypothetical protein [Persicimonas caeni]QDG49539.1 hypothetical protein FIV42_01935 [Persicimonas caeni]QED30760.1 hypothetical protein FRD00_01930 [Persicimonas caeni]